MNKVLIVYLLVINIAGFIIMGVDKKRAVMHEWRIPEKALFAVAAMGGAIGTTLGMNFYRHKTKHWYFKYGMPALALVWIYLFYVLIQ